MRVLIFHHKTQLHLQLLGTADDAENLLGFLRKLLEFGANPAQGLIEGVVLVAIFLEEFLPAVERKAAFSCRYQRKEQLGALAQ